MLTVLGGLADYAEHVIMRSVVAGDLVSAGLRRCRAPHNPWPWWGLSVRVDATTGTR
jgi:hypothetical protein